MDPLKVLVLYGGEEATKHRKALIEWLNSPALHKQIGRKIDARKVAEMVAHMEGSIDKRVEEMMNWADKGILLITRDDRSDYGAPNILEEFGRWIGQKGRQTALTLRQSGTKVHSNASGLVYVGFDDDVIGECRDRLVAFINDPIATTSGSAQPAQQTAQPTNQTINSGPTFNIGGNVGGDIVTGDKVGGDMINVTGDYVKGNVTGDYVKGNKVEGGDGNVAGRDNVVNYNGPVTIIQGDQHAAPTPSVGQTTTPASPSAAPGGAKVLTITDFRPFLMAHYSVSELKGLCFQLNVDPDEFEAGKSNLVIGLLGFMKRRNRLDDLLKELKGDPDDRLGEFFGKDVDLST